MMEYLVKRADQKLWPCLKKSMKKQHKEWRKIAKKERRRRIRVQKAKDSDKDEVAYMESEEYKIWLEEQEILQNFEHEQIEKCNFEEHQKWVQAEEIATKNWNFIQEKKRLQHELHLQREAKRKLEWEIEQKRKREEEEKLKQIEDEKKERHAIFMSNLEQFLLGNSVNPPAELLLSRQTRPNGEPCPFFTKTACCRFGDQCSRNHEYPGISKVLLAQNFFVHFGLNNTNPNEYDTDLMLEYEDSDTYKEFVDFFKDVFPEFEKFGKVIQFKVCNNYEKHLRGNTYVEFAELRCAVTAYRSLHSRWYGGRQLSLQFCHVDSWNSAICGLASRRRCPKGHACNFLHVFRNPNNLFNNRLDHPKAPSRRKNSTPVRSWRWSESPEREPQRRRRSNSSERKYHHDDKRYVTSHRDSSRRLRRKSSENDKR